MLKKTVESFSDEDLKQLKEFIGNASSKWKLVSLLARLESSEEFGENAALAHPALKFGDDYKAWRKAAGK